MARIFRLYAYLYHFVFALYLLGIAVVAKISNNILKMPFLPWSGDQLTTWLIGGAVTGIVSIALAVTGKFRFLFPLWTLAMLVLLVRGFFLQPYAFENKAAFDQILYLTAGALVAFLASLSLFFIRRKRIR
ncbi:MAG: hypothetical protein H7039_11670 [Bryobacteraceae bacterium]|nr:hypothetical protein [Bryobacteraceae bacterium]